MGFFAEPYSEVSKYGVLWSRNLRRRVPESLRMLITQNLLGFGLYSGELGELMSLHKRPLHYQDSGQALAEFAIMVVFLLMFMFFITDVARVGWVWVTVQGAARAGARYASTGQADCETPPNRLDCVTNTVYNYLDTLKLHEDPEAPWETDLAYRIEVWGVDKDNQGPWPDYAGAAGKPVVVRTYHWVLIVSPFLRPIRKNIAVFGQVTITNEQFDSLGGASAGIGLPPPLPPLPEVQPTATLTPTMVPTATPVVTATATATHTPTASSTPVLPRCDTHFERYLIAGEAYVAVTGNLDAPPSLVKIYEMSEVGGPLLIGTATLVGSAGVHDCEGFVLASNSPPLIAGHLIMVENDIDGSFDTETVLGGTPTSTPSPTPSPPATATPVPSPIPSGPYIRLEPSCGFAGNVRFAIEAYNWTNTTSSVNLFWIDEGEAPLLQSIIGSGHPSDFVRYWNISDVITGTHTVEARSEDPPKQWTQRRDKLSTLVL